MRRRLVSALKAVQEDPSCAAGRLTYLIERIDADDLAPRHRGRSGHLPRENQRLADRLLELYGVASPIEAINLALKQAVARLDCGDVD